MFRNCIGDIEQFDFDEIRTRIVLQPTGGRFELEPSSNSLMLMLFRIRCKDRNSHSSRVIQNIKP
jgi:hypothetical protein